MITPTFDRAPGYLWLIITVGPVALTIDLIKVHGFEARKIMGGFWDFLRFFWGGGMVQRSE